MALEIRQFPCLQDNYGFLVRCSETGEVAVIDTPEAEVILEEAQTLGWPISAIWNTHHHWDHAGGNAAIAKATGAQIIAPRAEQATIGHVDQPVSPGDTVMLGHERAQVIDVGGHTLGHVAYWFEDAGVAFVGDSLFALGCGRMFEGTPEQMWDSLKKIRNLPDETHVYCAHEYTLDNAAFAETIEKSNPLLKSYRKKIEKMRSKNEPTVPSVLAIEKSINPFLRCDHPAVKKAVGMEKADPAEVFAEVRKRKDNFRG